MGEVFNAEIAEDAEKEETPIYLRGLRDLRVEKTTPTVFIGYIATLFN